MERELYQYLKTLVPDDRIKKNEPMDRHTSFKVGGPADFFVCPGNTAELSKLIIGLNRENIPRLVLGNGSNMLIGDKGIRGVVVHLIPGLSDITIKENRITADAGAILSSVSKMALDAALTGLEFASGIPGTVGGAMVMNAGAYGGEMADIVESVEVLLPDGQVSKLQGAQLEFGYRDSIFKRSDYIALKTVFIMSRGDRQEIGSHMQELKEKRQEKQPLQYPSAGSTFKRPKDSFAGKLIMEAGLSGFSIGGAQVSEKHCGFIINKGGATAADIRALIEAVQEKVRDSFGVELEPEVCMAGEF
ncbi:MAG: UDP-N-acetylmuramate dehydrogenase [Lachnospiraceae bacterium]|nr:UDP-N-acetylmuramate dehydrogenase [Lachnospiraceae bacterium]